MNGQDLINFIYENEDLPVIVRYNTDYTGGYICESNFNIHIVNDACIYEGDDDSIYWPEEQSYKYGIPVPYKLVSAIIIDVD